MFFCINKDVLVKIFNEYGIFMLIGKIYNGLWLDLNKLSVKYSGFEFSVYPMNREKFSLKLIFC
jgi:hypothetical protein